MGFRNPITTAIDQAARDLAEDAYQEATNGIIPGSRLASDAIDGRTITGATIKTAAVAGSQRGSIADSLGHRWYDDEGTKVTEVRTSDGRLIARGADLSGLVRTSDVGPRLEMQSGSTSEGSTTRSDSSGWFRLISGLGGVAPAGLTYDATARYVDVNTLVPETTSLQIAGGNISGSTTPRVWLESGPAAAGGVESVVRIGADRLSFGGAATFANQVTAPGSLRTAVTNNRGRWVYPDDFGTWTGITPVTGWTPLLSRMTRRLANITYSCRMESRSWSANQRIAEFGVAASPAEDQTFWCGTNEIRLRASDGVMFLPAAGSGVLAFQASWPVA